MRVVVSGSLRFYGFRSLLHSAIVASDPLLCCYLRRFLFVAIGDYLLFVRGYRRRLYYFRRVNPAFRATLLWVSVYFLF